MTVTQESTSTPASKTKPRVYQFNASDLFELLQAYYGKQLLAEDDLQKFRAPWLDAKCIQFDPEAKKGPPLHKFVSHADMKWIMGEIKKIPVGCNGHLIWGYYEAVLEMCIGRKPYGNSNYFNPTDGQKQDAIKTFKELLAQRINITNPRKYNPPTADEGWRDVRK